MKKLNVFRVFWAIWIFGTALPTLAADLSGYSSVTGPCDLQFPRDHGPHPGYRTEWWYYTGNVQDVRGHPYGFQLTFFRSRIAPKSDEKSWPDPVSAWRTHQIYLAHAAVSDIRQKRHLQAEAAARGVLEIAGAHSINGGTTVFLKKWSAQITPDSQILKAETDGFSIHLMLTPMKPPTLHGDDGYSRKGEAPDRASCYYSISRLATRGELAVGGESFTVQGSSWMDHEYSSAPLEPGIVGWDWFSLQFADGTELMVYLLRRETGGLHPASSGTFIAASGEGRHLDRNDLKVEILERWKSPHSGGVYPSRWRLQIIPLQMELIIAPRFHDQEMQTLKSTGIHYWEGSIRIEGTKNKRPIEGRGYAELTGYAKPLDERL